QITKAFSGFLRFNLKDVVFSFESLGRFILNHCISRAGVSSTLICFAALVFVLFQTGCLHVNRPPIPKTLDSGNRVQYSVEDFNDAYSKYLNFIQAGDFDKAKVQRDIIIGRIEVDVESNYREYEGKLSSTRAAVDTLSDATEL